jgi:hypothetical protein
MLGSRKVKRVLTTLGVVFVAGISAGEQFAFVGPRAAGMGGANAASTRDATAQYHNPAAFGFMGRSEWATNSVDNGDLSGQGFSMEVFGMNIGYGYTEDVGRYLDILSEIDFDAFDSGTLSSSGENVKGLLSVAGIIGKIDSGDALYADASAGIAIQMGRLGIGLRTFAEGVGYALPDRNRLSLDSYASTADLVGEIDAAAGGEGFSGAGYVFSALSPDQQADLGATLGVAPTSDTVKYLDSKLGELIAEGDLERDEIAAAVDTFSALADVGGTSIDENQTAVVGRGFLMVEVPVSYGWALNKNLSVGVTAKAMYGNVLGTQIWIFDEDNDEVFSELSDNINSSLNVGLDVGVLYRIPNFQFALVGHNLNRPSFDGFTEKITVNGVEQTVKIPDVTIDPQITFGAAFIPFRRLVLESNIDLLETGTMLDDYNVQRFSVGGELDVWLLALRLGAYRNIASSWQDWVATAGVGVNIFGVRLDVGGAYSLGDTVEFDNSTVPPEARLFASIGLDF